MMRRTFVVLVIVLVGVGVGLWAFSGRSREPSAEHIEHQRRFDAAKATAGSLPLVPLGTVDRLEDLVRGRLDQVAVPAGLPAGSAAQLASAVGGFLAARFGDGTPQDYIRWRREAGYEPRSLDDLRATWFLDETHEFLFGRPAPDDAPWEELHAAVLSGMDRARGGRHRLVRVAGTADGVAVAVKRLTRVDPSWPAVGGVVGELLDTGNTISSNHPWWKPPTDDRTLLAERGEAVVAQVSFVAEFGDGTRRPVTLSHVWDPVRNRWWLIAAHVGVTRRGIPRQSDPIRLEF